MVLTAGSDQHAILESVRAASEELRARSEEAAAARARVEMLLAGQDKARAAATGPLAVFVLDRSGRIEGTAGATLLRLGLRPEDLTGRSIFDVYADRSDLVDAIRRALSGEETSLRVSIAGHAIDARTAPVRDREGRPAGALSVWVDVTERERAAAQLKAAEAELRAALAQRGRNGSVPAPVSDEAIEAAASTRIDALREIFEAERRELADRVQTAEAAAESGRVATSKVEGRDDLIRAGALRERAQSEEIARLTGEVDGLRAELGSVRAELVSARSERDRADNELAAVSEAARVAKDNVIVARAQTDAATEQRDEARIRAQVATREAATARLEALEAGARMRAALDEIASLRGELPRLEEAASTARRDAEAAAQQAGVAAKEIAALRADAAISEERIAALKDELERARDEAAKARQEAASTEERIAEAVRAAEDARARTDAALGEAAAARLGADEARRVLELERSERARIESDLRSLTQRLNVAVDEAARARARAQDSEEHLSAATIDAGAARTQAESLGREAADARKQADEARGAIDAVRAERASAQSALADARERLRAASEELAELRVRADESETARRTAQAELNDLRAGSETLAGQVGQAMTAIEAATAEAAGARARAAEAEHRLATVIALRPVPADLSGDGQATANAETTGSARAVEASKYDALTRLPDRRSLLATLEQGIERARREREPLSLLLLDIDNFKDINDTFGHQIGDTIIKQMAERIANTVREHDIVARLGGDEFAVVLPGADVERAAAAARDLLQVIERPFSGPDEDFDVQASIGVAPIPAESVAADELLRRAEVAMYEAKRSHGGYVAYSPDDDERSPERLMLLGDLRRAIARDELRLFWQPQVKFTTGQIVGMEALVRWDHPRRGLLPPGVFVPLAERTGVIKPLHDWVLRAALRQVKEWSQTWDAPRIAVNTSMPNVLDPRLVDTVQRMLREAEVAPEWLCVEVTESMIMGDPERARSVVSDLRTMGVRISIDDFGTGYSSLGYLQQLDVNEIKIDKSFVIGVADDRARAAIVRTSIDLGHHFGLEVVAEGVEDQRSWDILFTTACDTAQGYHISPPLPAAEVVRSLTDRGWIRHDSDRGLRLS